MLQNKSQWLLGLLAQGIEDVGCGSVEVVAAGVADEGALGSGLLAGFADQGVPVWLVLMMSTSAPWSFWTSK